MQIKVSTSINISDWSNGLTLEHLRTLVYQAEGWDGALPIVQIGGDVVYELQVGPHE